MNRSVFFLFDWWEVSDVDLPNLKGALTCEVGETLEFILEFMCETDIRVLTSNNGGVGVGTCFFF